jgi:hypothetical protein
MIMARTVEEPATGRLQPVIETGGFDQFVRHAHDELPHEKDAEGVGEVRRDHPGDRRIQAEIPDDPIERDQGHDRRQEHGRDEDGEQRIPKAKIVFGESVARHQARDVDGCRGDDRNDSGVEERPSEAEDIRDLPIRVEIGVPNPILLGRIRCRRAGYGR